ncbi:poly-gamma-glutamate synthase PgsB [Actinosynnema sp. NPDC047251]|uniref:Capsule biosynthesis protein CapB n=1 Tax=Saccharothrix espanaensis (strain ATCC 51144 / DSM 44229 / JCM 9112 / NBRC 15066 / NRRL 15764) TaxID=1179773 RepID=K0K0X6_SACES|nr:poly-gamma-glutamate synthase PgsB [Saccharothrix espanaensis]CCH30223.1 capsule biosynthesis protein CapB [Saccharothrix espanaensis DSM 44229]
MTYLYVVFVVLCTGTLVAGILEQRRHLAQLDSIEHRVLVNGIRGKSSITRLCAGALRGGGLVTTAKTTGTAARFIHPDGSEEPVYRKWDIANVVEQIGIVRRAAAYRSDVLVIECMAVMPDLQEINQSKLIRSTIGVLCNVREDHLAEMGPTLDDVARSLSRSMPVGGVCVTAERDRLHILEQEAAKRDCELISVDPESVTDEDMAGFSWVTFKENVAIALKVAELLGVNRSLALTGMWTAPPDPGVLSVQTRAVGDKRIKLANVFAANDPESTLMNIERLLEQGAIARPLHVVVNCRPDRVERNRQMGALIARIDPDRVVLIGEPTRSALSTVDEQWRDRVTDLGGALGPQELLDGIMAKIDSTASLVAIGNIHGQGEVLLEVIEHLEEPPEAPPVEPARAQEVRAQEVRAQEVRAQEVRAQEVRAQEARPEPPRARPARPGNGAPVRPAPDGPRRPQPDARRAPGDRQSPPRPTPSDAARNASAETRYLDPGRPVRERSPQPPQPPQPSMPLPRPQPRPARRPAPEVPREVRGNLFDPPAHQPNGHRAPRRPDQRPAPRPPEQS